MRKQDGQSELWERLPAALGGEQRFRRRLFVTFILCSSGLNGKPHSAATMKGAYTSMKPHSMLMRVAVLIRPAGNRWWRRACLRLLRLGRAWQSGWQQSTRTGYQSGNRLKGQPNAKVFYRYFE